MARVTLVRAVTSSQGLKLRSQLCAGGGWVQEEAGRGASWGRSQAKPGMCPRRSLSPRAWQRGWGGGCHTGWAGVGVEGAGLWGRSPGSAPHLFIY